MYFTKSSVHPRAHFVGILGIGVSSLARWFLSQNWAVSGSDAKMSDLGLELRKDGVEVKIGHKTSNLPRQAELVIYSQAIPANNPELVEAKRRGLSTMSYPEAIGLLTKNYKTIAIAGAHGKTTTTALVGLSLKAAGFDPTIVIGTKLKELGGKNFRLGRKAYLVLEADEYRNAFLNYSPLITIVTNIDREHLDFFKNLRTIKKSFLQFISQTREHGTVILNLDDENVRSLKRSIQRLAPKKHWKVIWYSTKDISLVKKLRRSLKIPGAHNVSNALGALHATRALEIPDARTMLALKNYHGAWRRMEHKGKVKIMDTMCEVYDDYAHHPTEVRATLAAFREKFPKEKLICIFQPHQAERLRLLFKEFQSVFIDADITLVLPSFAVAGRDSANQKFNAEALVASIQKKYKEKLLFYIKDPRHLRAALSKLLSSPTTNNQRLTPRAIIVMMGAGTIVNYTSLLLRKK